MIPVEYPITLCDTLLSFVATKMSFLRGSANYVWCTTSVLGKGATGAVFQVDTLFDLHVFIDGKIVYCWHG